MTRPTATPGPATPDQAALATSDRPGAANPQLAVPAPSVHAMEGLKSAQVLAFEVLTSGGSIVAAATAAGVSRQTIYKWLRPGRRFQKAYELWKSSLVETARTRLVMLAQRSTYEVARAIQEGDTRAALALLKGMGILAPPPTGPTLAESQAQLSRTRAAQAAAAAAAQNELAALMGGASQNVDEETDDATNGDELPGPRDGEDATQESQVGD